MAEKVKPKKGTHGGARKGAGRKPTGRLRIYETISIALLPEERAELDRQRGEKSVSSYIREALKLRVKDGRRQGNDKKTLLYKSLMYK